MNADAQPDLTGRVMVGLDGIEFTTQDSLRLEQPAVGGVCLFSRNYADTPRLAQLVKDARASVAKPLAIGVDHEGGRVQRFVGEGFPQLRPPRKLGEAYARNREGALSEALERSGAIAQQLRAVDIDFTFAPVLDIDYGRNPMIDSRCFASEPAAVAALALAFCQGLREHGMPTIGKHFPGHGWARADTHLEVAVDDRGLEPLMESDLLPYIELLGRDMLDAVLIAHVHCRELASQPSTYAPEIIVDLLRERLGQRRLREYLLEHAIFTFEQRAQADELSATPSAGFLPLAERTTTSLNPVNLGWLNTSMTPPPKKDMGRTSLLHCHCHCC